MDRHELVNALEGLIFAAGDPITLAEIKSVFERLWELHSEERRQQLLAELRPALHDLEERWRAKGNARGFTLVPVAEGWAFRSNPRYSAVIAAMREERPQRLSKAALETLAIVAYRQPVTKPEVDHIRGVDSGATLKLLLERGQLRIVGKKEEPGRPLLYGTTRQFLSLFNLSKLAELPTLRDVNELNEEAEESLRTFDGISGLAELSKTARHIQLEAEPAVRALDNALHSLRSTERTARDALASEGIALDPAPDAEDEGAEGAGAGPAPGGDEAAGDTSA